MDTPVTETKEQGLSVVEPIYHPDVGEVGRIPRATLCVHLANVEAGLLTEFIPTLHLDKHEKSLLETIIMECAKDPEHIVDFDVLEEVTGLSARTLRRRMDAFFQLNICLPARKIRYPDGKLRTFYILRVSDKSHTEMGRAVGPIASRYLCTHLDVSKHFKCDSFSLEVLVSMLRSNTRGKDLQVKKTRVVISNQSFPITVASQSDDVILSVEDYRLVSVALESVRQQIANMPPNERTFNHLKGQEWHILEDDILEGAMVEKSYHNKQRCLQAMNRAAGTSFDLTSIPKSKLMSLSYPRSGKRDGKMMKVSIFYGLKVNLNDNLSHYSFKIDDHILEMLIANKGKSLHKEYSRGQLNGGIEDQLYLWTRRYVGHSTAIQTFPVTEIRDLATPASDVRSVRRCIDRIFKERECELEYMPVESWDKKYFKFATLPGCYIARHISDTDTLYLWANIQDEIVSKAIELETIKYQRLESN